MLEIVKFVNLMIDVLYDLIHPYLRTEQINNLIGQIINETNESFQFTKYNYLIFM